MAIHIGMEPSESDMHIDERERAAAYVKQALEILGFNSHVHSTRDTPTRFVEYLQEFMQTYDAHELLGVGFDAPEDAAARQQGVHGMVVQWNIPFRMCCEHHLLPAYGRAALAYIPNERFVGISKLTRLVQAAGTLRPSLQEVISERIADDLTMVLKPKGVMVVVDAEHTCMACRGVNMPSVVTTTSVIRGAFRDVPAAREEFFSIVGPRRSI